jgi:Fe-S-cluster containining protein
MAGANQCTRCGACCAMFTVAIEGSEIIVGGAESIPVGLTALVGRTAKRAMKGTEGHRKRCVALTGIVGKGVACSIYDHRPSACRGFLAAWEPGIINPRCSLAREAYGLFAFSLF